MSDRLRWCHAEEALQWLHGAPGCRAILSLLARLPFVDVWVLQRLTGALGGASIYRSVARLKERDLVAAIQPPLYPAHSPTLLYLTDLGLATVALDQGFDVRSMAERLRLRGSDLLTLVPALPHLLNAYELLGAVAASRPEQPQLLAWERPWHRRYHRPTAKRPVSVTLPAHAVLLWGDESASYLLLPDRGTVPLRLFRGTIEHLLQLRRFQHGSLPLLIIAAPSRERMMAWQRLLEEVRRAQREVPLAHCIACWDDLAAGLQGLVGLTQARPASAARLIRPIQVPPLRPRRSTGLLPRIVGDALMVPSGLPEAQRLGHVALTITPHDHTLLEVIGLHPFLTPNQLADVLNWKDTSVRRRLHRLISLNLIRLADTDEAGLEGESELVELTINSLELVSVQLGLSLPVAARELGLTGGGPDNPIGSRRKLLQHLSHTRGADALVVGLYRTASQLRARGGDDTVVEWQNATACSRGHLRPDGYVVYRHGGRCYGFFLEYDRGSMSARDYFKKFAAYYHYGLSRRFERDYQGYPTVLIVAADNATEGRIAHVARAAALAHSAKLPLLLTTQWRLDDPHNPYGLLGSIWREADADVDDRRYCLPRLKEHRMPASQGVHRQGQPERQGQ